MSKEPSVESLQGEIKTLQATCDKLEKELAAQKEANAELIEKLEAATEAATSGIATVTIGKEVYRAKSGRWLDRASKKYVTIADCAADKTLAKAAIEAGMLVPYEGGKG